ncbi:AbrB family transcriptional regulator [Xanthobacter sp. KR7-225]|uniref:AbrB family transcriptional regulator n=1 Tax=Xanthobacter sp. KR7-225 TaxID=3156613 RepID=UPI0032B3786F
MRPEDSRGRRARASLLTLAAGGLGGFAFHLLGLPAAWISGALLLTLALALAQVEVQVPKPIEIASYIVLGTSMGTALTPDLVAQAVTWPISMAFLTVSVFCTMAGSMLYFRYLARWSLETAFYASAPGAFSAVVGMAAESGADLRRVAFAQTVRLFLLVAALPNILGATGLTTAQVAAPAQRGGVMEVALLLLAGTVCGLLAGRVRMPGGVIVGALLASAGLHLAGLSTATLPPALLVPAFVVLGCNVGVRFRGTSLRTVREMTVVSVVAFVVAASISAVFALIAAVVTRDDPGKLLTAFAPGALEAMTALGFALGYDPAFMSAHHLFRFAGLSVALPLVARLLFAVGKGR